jgi:DNA-binding response OmpR family regulator
MRSQSEASSTTGYIDVPRRLTRYVQRGEEEARILEILLDNRRGVTVIGPGGAGKTRLIQEACYDERMAHRVGVTFCALENVTTAEEVYRVIATRLGWSLAPQQLRTSLMYQLRLRGPRLLVLDGVEALRDDLRTLIPDLLHDCPDVSLVATSRVPMGYDGEVLFWLGPLDAEGPTGRLLFTERAELAGVRVGDSHEEHARIERILAQLSHLPLAIELAASQLRFMSLSELEQQIHQRTTVDPSKPTISDLMDVCCEHSWSTLKPWEQAALAQLSIVPHPFSLALASHMIEVALWREAPRHEEIVHQLLLHSMLAKLQHPEYGTRFQILHPVRAWLSKTLEVQAPTSGTLELEDLSVDLQTGVVKGSNHLARLAEKECQLLRYLAERPGVTITRETLLCEVWGYRRGVVSRTVDTTMRTLRSRVDVGEWKYLRTERGVGYRYVDRPNEGAARIAAQQRHAEWLLIQARMRRKSIAFSTDLRDFVREHVPDYLLAVQWAIQRRDGDLVHALTHHSQGQALRLTSAEVEVLPPMLNLEDISHLRTFIRLLMAARRYDLVDRYTQDLPEHGHPVNRFAIRVLRTQALGRQGRSEQADVELNALLSFELSADVEWIKLAVQAQLAERLLQLDRFGEARALLDNPTLPYARKQGHGPALQECQIADGRALMWEGQVRQGLLLLEGIAKVDVRWGMAQAYLATHQLLEFRDTGVVGHLNRFRTHIQRALEHNATQDAYEFAGCLGWKSYGLTLAGELEAAREAIDTASDIVGTLPSRPRTSRWLGLVRCEWLLATNELFDLRLGLDELAIRLVNTPKPLQTIWHRTVEARYGLRTNAPAHTATALDDAEQMLSTIGCGRDTAHWRFVRSIRQQLGEPPT